MAELLLQGLNDVEIKRKVIDENIFQVKTEARKREIASAVLKRLKSVDIEIVNKIVTSNVSTSKVLVFYSIIKTDRLLFEFMNEVYRLKIDKKDFQLCDKDFDAFFETKKKQSERVASWKDYTFYKLQQVYLRILSEAGLLRIEKGIKNITPPVLNPKLLEDLIEFDNSKYFRAIIGSDEFGFYQYD